MSNQTPGEGGGGLTYMYMSSTGMCRGKYPLFVLTRGQDPPPPFWAWSVHQTPSFLVCRCKPKPVLLIMLPRKVKVINKYAPKKPFCEHQLLRSSVNHTCNWHSNHCQLGSVRQRAAFIIPVKSVSFNSFDYRRNRPCAIAHALWRL